MILQDIRKGWPLIVLGLIASMCLIRGCSIIMSPDMQEHHTSAGIRHLVFLKLQADVDKAEVIKEIKKIKEINVLHDLEVGLFKDLGDARSMSDYDVTFSMHFDDATAYADYQDDPIHLLLKEFLKDVLAGPPVTYDYEIR